MSNYTIDSATSITLTESATIAWEGIGIDGEEIAREARTEARRMAQDTQQDVTIYAHNDRGGWVADIVQYEAPVYDMAD